MRSIVTTIGLGLALPTLLAACGDETLDGSAALLDAPSPIVEIEAFADQARDGGDSRDFADRSAASGSAPSSGLIGSPIKTKCPPGFAPAEQVIGGTNLGCNACVPVPGPEDFAECYQDSDCGFGEFCKVDPLNCTVPDYCGCWGGPQCVLCIDCACGGVCRVDSSAIPIP